MVFIIFIHLSYKVTKAQRIRTILTPDRRYTSTKTDVLCLLSTGPYLNHMWVVLESSICAQLRGFIIFQQHRTGREIEIIASVSIVWCVSAFSHQTILMFPGIVIWAEAWQNQQNNMCTQRKLRSAWASAQSDQNLRCPHEETLNP